MCYEFSYKDCLAVIKSFLIVLLENTLYFHRISVLICSKPIYYKKHKRNICCKTVEIL